jgi:uncharacterized protein
MDFTTVQWFLLGIAAFAVGVAKMGLSAVILLIIPVVAGVFGGKESTGLLLPLLIAGDIFAVVYYRHRVQIGAIRSLLVWVCAGIAVGMLAGRSIDDSLFRAALSVSVIVCLAAMVYAEAKGKQLTVPNKPVFYALIGILGGFTSMVGNAAGPIISIYLLSRGYPKESYISTYAWLFLLINLIKLPLQIFVWNNVGVTNLYITLLLLPVILAGAVTGAYVVRRINEKLYRRTVYAMTLVAAVALWI